MYQKTHAPFGQTKPTGIKRLSDNAFIPFDEQNVDYADYLAWLALGNVPTPADEQPTE